MIMLVHYGIKQYQLCKQIVRCYWIADSWVCYDLWTCWCCYCCSIDKLTELIKMLKITCQLIPLWFLYWLIEQKLRLRGSVAEYLFPSLFTHAWQIGLRVLWYIFVVLYVWASTSFLSIFLVVIQLLLTKYEKC